MIIQNRIKPEIVVPITKIDKDELVIFNKKPEVHKYLLGINTLDCEINKYSHEHSLLYNATCDNQEYLNALQNCELLTISETTFFTITLEKNFDVDILIYAKIPSDAHVFINKKPINKTLSFITAPNVKNIAIQVQITSEPVELCINVFDVNTKVVYKENNFGLFVINNSHINSYVIKPKNETYYAVYKYLELDSDFEIIL